MLSENSTLQCLTNYSKENARELCVSKELLLCISPSFQCELLLQNFHFTFKLWYVKFFYDLHVQLLWGK